MDPETTAAGDTAAQPATSAAAPAVGAAAPASAPAAAPTTLLTAAADTATPEAKPTDAAATDAKAGEGTKAAGSDEADAHAPEEYAAFELPEGAKLDEDFTTGFKPIAKELDLPQGKANKLAQFAAQEHQRLSTKFVSDLQQRVDDNAKEWEASVKADPELGGERHAEVMGVAAKALNEFGSPAFKQFLNESRLGSNPEMVRLLYKAGKAISQDGVSAGRQSAGAPKADADVFYGNKA